MSLTPCKFTIVSSGKVLSYDEARQYLIDNPEMWMDGRKEEGGVVGKKGVEAPKITSYAEVFSRIEEGAGLSKETLEEELPYYLNQMGLPPLNEKTKATQANQIYQDLLSRPQAELLDTDSPIAAKMAEYVRAQQNEYGIKPVSVESRIMEDSILDSHIDAVDKLRDALKKRTLNDPFLFNSTTLLLLDIYAGILKAAREAGKAITRAHAMYEARQALKAKGEYSDKELEDAANAILSYEKGTVKADINRTTGAKNQSTKARIQKAINKAFDIGMGFGKQEGFQKGATQGMKAGFVAGADVTRTKIKDIISEAIATLKGELSPKQVQQILNGIPKVFTKASHEKFSELVNNIIDDANYVDRVSDINSMQRKLRNKDYGNHTSLVKQFLAINPRAIPANLLSDYEQALNGLAQKRVPDVKVMNAVYNDIMDLIDPPATRNQLDKLVREVASLSENKIESLEDYFELSTALSGLEKTLNKLIAQGEISEADAEFVRESYNKAETTLLDGTKIDVQKQVTALKTKMINDAKQLSADVDMDGLTDLQKETGNALMRIPISILQDFTPGQLDAYQKAIIGLSNGFLNTTTYDLIKQAGLIEKARSIAEASKDVVQAKADTEKRSQLHQLVGKFGGPMWKSVDKMTAQLLLKNKDYWDDFFGVGKKKPIWKKILSPIIDAVDKALHQAKVLSSNYYKAVSGADEIQKDRVALALIQMDYEANPSIIKGETIDHKDLPTEEKDYYRYITENLDSFARVDDKEKARIKRAWKSMPKDGNGNVDIKAYVASLSKKEKQILDAVREIYSKSEDYVRINTEKRGDIFQLRQEYANRMVRQKSEVEDASNAQFIEDILGGKTPAAIRLKQAATNKRTGDRYYVSYNLDNMILSHIRDTFRDYYLTDPVRTTIGAMSRLATRSQKNSDQQRFLVAMEEAIKQGLITTLDLQQEGSDQVSRTVDAILRANRTLKLSTVRFLADFVSNLSRLAIENPAAYTRATEILIDKDQKYDHLLEQLFTSVSDFSGILGQESITSSKDALSKFSDRLIGLGDAGPMKVSAITLFEKAFKKQTGKDFDIDAFLDPDNTYRDDNAKAILSAKQDSQLELSKEFVPSSAFAQSSHTKLVPFTEGTKSLLSKKKWVAKMFGFLQSYTIHEATKTAQAFKDLALGTNEGRVKAAQRIASVQISNAVYMVGMSMLAQAFKEISDDDDEPWDEEAKKVLSTWTDDLGSMFVGNNLSLLTGRYGPIFRALIAVSLGIAKTALKDSEQKENVEKLAQYANEGLYTNPVTDKSTGTDWLRLVPAIGSTGATLLRGTYSTAKVSNELLQGKDPEEKDRLLALQMLNILASMAIRNPITPSLDKYLSAKRKNITDKEREGKAKIQQARALLKPEEESRKRANEVIDAAIQTGDVKTFVDAVETLKGTYETGFEKRKVLKEVAKKALSEGTLTEKIGLEQSYLDEFFTIYKTGQMRAAQSEYSKKQLDRIRQLYNNRELTESIMQTYKAEYQQALKAMEFLKSTGLYDKEDVERMRPRWMRTYERKMLNQ
jgi:hypothetical protein